MTADEIDARRTALVLELRRLDTAYWGRQAIEVLKADPSALVQILVRGNGDRGDCMFEFRNDELLAGIVAGTLATVVVSLEARLNQPAEARAS